jgi:hypothetical protein
MSNTSTLVLGRLYRVDTGNILALCAIECEQRVSVSDVAFGTEFRTQGSTSDLREKFGILHACHLVIHFGERGEAYFIRENDQHVPLTDCNDLKLVAVELPYMGH